MVLTITKQPIRRGLNSQKNGFALDKIKQFLLEYGKELYDVIQYDII
jgi:hypothetical protein